MINTKILIDLDNKLKDIKTISKKEESKKEEKVNSDFKDYLNKEVENDNSKSLANNTSVQENNKTYIGKNEISENEDNVENILSEVANKIEELIDSGNFIESNDFIKSESDIDALSEILILLSRLLNKNLSNENLITTDSEVNSLNNSSLDNIENLFLTLFNSKEDTKIADPLQSLELLSKSNNNSGNIDIKDLLRDLKGSTNSILEDINLNTFESNTIEDYKGELSNKIISLLELLPKESIEKISSSIKEKDKLKIVSALILQKVNNEDNIIEESTSNTRVIVNDNVVDNKANSLDKNSNKDKNLNYNNSLKQNALDENNDEDKILSKIIDNDSKGSFSKVLSYYDKFNKNNVEVIKEPIVVNKQTLDLDVIKNVKFMMKNAVQELKVKIYPKELGEMTIKILSEEGIMRAEIKATSKETYNLLNSNLHEIKKSLVDQNIKIQEVNIGIYNEDTTFFNGKENSSDNFRNQQSRDNNNNNPIFIDDEEIKEELLNESNVNLLA